eukprot:7277629-Pyramimonas_sp.AAC.1
MVMFVLREAVSSSGQRPSRKKKGSDGQNVGSASTPQTLYIQKLQGSLAMMRHLEPKAEGDEALHHQEAVRSLGPVLNHLRIKRDSEKSESQLQQQMLGRQIREQKQLE